MLTEQIKVIIIVIMIKQIYTYFNNDNLSRTI